MLASTTGGTEKKKKEKMLMSRVTITVAAAFRAFRKRSLSGHEPEASARDWGTASEGSF